MRGKWAEAKEYAQLFDIVTLTESKLDTTVTAGAVAIENYFVNRLDRNNNGGGVITFIKEQLKPVSLDDVQANFNKKGLEVTVTLVEAKKHKEHVVLGVYRPPS